MRHAKKQESMSHALEKKQAKKLSETPHVRFIRKRLSSSHCRHVHRNKVTHKVAKEEMMTMSCHIRVLLKKQKSLRK